MFQTFMSDDSQLAACRLLLACTTPKDLHKLIGVGRTLVSFSKIQKNAEMPCQAKKAHQKNYLEFLYLPNSSNKEAIGNT